MANKYRTRRLIGLLVFFIFSAVTILSQPALYAPVTPKADPVIEAKGQVVDVLNQLPVKGRAPKTGYARTQFGEGWAVQNGCDTRNIILNRDLSQIAISEDCKVQSGVLVDPYTNKTINFARGSTSSQLVQIDHVVALSNAWQTGAQQLTFAQREALANDPLELLAVDGAANQQKSDGDAATWLPANKPFRCQYVTRQVAVKQKYSLWVTVAEKEAIERVLSACPGQTMPV